MKTLDGYHIESTDKEIGNSVDTVQDRIQNEILTALDSIVAPKIEFSFRSVNASSGRDATSVVASCQRGEQLGITAPSENVSERTIHYMCWIQMNRPKQNAGRVNRTVGPKDTFLPATTNSLQFHRSKVCSYLFARYLPCTFSPTIFWVSVFVSYRIYCKMFWFSSLSCQCGFWMKIFHQFLVPDFSLYLILLFFCSLVLTKTSSSRNRCWLS